MRDPRKQRFLAFTSRMKILHAQSRLNKTNMLQEHKQFTIIFPPHPYPDFPMRRDKFDVQIVLINHCRCPYSELFSLTISHASIIIFLSQILNDSDATYILNFNLCY